MSRTITLPNGSKLTLTQEQFNDIKQQFEKPAVPYMNRPAKLRIHWGNYNASSPVRAIIFPGHPDHARLCKEKELGSGGAWVIYIEADGSISFDPITALRAVTACE